MEQQCQVRCLFAEVKASPDLFFPSPQGYSERVQCPYAEAFILEVQRKGDILPMSVLHKATRDFLVTCPKTSRQYTIPKGTQVIPFISSAMKDEEHFGDPETFRPERFINKDGVFVPDPKVYNVTSECRLFLSAESS